MRRRESQPGDNRIRSSRLGRLVATALSLIFSRSPGDHPTLHLSNLRPFSFERFSTTRFPNRRASTPLDSWPFFLRLVRRTRSAAGTGGHYVQLQEAFSRSNSAAWRSFDHDPEERLGSIGNEVAPWANSFPRKRVTGQLGRSFLLSLLLIDSGEPCRASLRLYFAVQSARPIGNRRNRAQAFHSLSLYLPLSLLSVCLSISTRAFVAVLIAEARGPPRYTRMIAGNAPRHSGKRFESSFVFCSVSCLERVCDISCRARLRLR